MGGGLSQEELSSQEERMLLEKVPSQIFLGERQPCSAPPAAEGEEGKVPRNKAVKL